MSLILMLEDDIERIARFKAVVLQKKPETSIKICRTAFDFQFAHDSLEAPPEIICLDHDLFTDSPNDPDPGDGRDVADFLVTRRTQCPVLIHSSNSVAADSMLSP